MDGRRIYKKRSAEQNEGYCFAYVANITEKFGEYVAAEHFCACGDQFCKLTERRLA